MSNVTIASNPVGTATFTLASPATNTNRTLTLPDENGELATTADVAAAAAAVESMVLLGTLTVGAQTLSGLDLTGYKQLFFDINAVSHNNGTATALRVGANPVITNVTTSDWVAGGVWVSLWSSVAISILTREGATLGSGSQTGQIANTGYTNATTSVGISFAAGTMDNGSVRVYGVK